MTGHWVSEQCQSTPQGGYRSDLVLSAGVWTLAVASYADDACQQQLFSAQVGGRWLVLSPSAAAPTARSVFFGREFRQLTPTTAGGVGLLTAACPDYTWAVGQTTEVSTGGCLFFRSAAECAGEYDLLARVGGRLFLAARPAAGDLCDPRTPIRTLGEGLVPA